MAMELRLQCTMCFTSLGSGPLRPATIVFMNALAAEHVCLVEGQPPSSSAMSAAEIQALIDKDKAS